MARSTGTVDVRLATGVRMRVDLADRLQRLQAFRAYERRELALVRSLLRAGDVVVDVGAHVGYYALHAAALVGPAGRVHAFEPVPANARRLHENVALNGFENVVVNEAAVSAEAGRRAFGVVEIPGESGWGSLLVAGQERSAEVEVEVVTLDSYARTAEPQGAALVKVDVQGNEMDVLAGARDLLAGAGPDVLCEADPYWLAQAGRSPAELIHFMTELGYRAWDFPSRGPAVRLRRDEPCGLNLFFTRRDDLGRR